MSFILAACRQRADEELRDDDLDTGSPDEEQSQENLASNPSRLTGILNTGAGLIGSVFKGNRATVSLPGRGDNQSVIPSRKQHADSVQYPESLQKLLEDFDLSCKILAELVTEIRSLMVVDQGHKGSAFLERLETFGKIRGGELGESAMHVATALSSVFQLEAEIVKTLSQFYSDVDTVVQFDINKVQDAVVMLEKTRRNFEAALTKYKRQTHETRDPKSIAQAEQIMIGRREAFEANVYVVTDLIPEINQRMDAVFARGFAGYLRARYRLFADGSHLLSGVESDIQGLDSIVAQRVSAREHRRVQLKERDTSFTYPLLRVVASPNFAVCTAVADIVAELATEDGTSVGGGVYGEIGSEVMIGMVCILDDLDMALPFVRMLISADIRNVAMRDGIASLFRTNTAATRVMSAVAQISGSPYVNLVIGDMIRAIILQLATMKRTVESPDLDFARDSADALISSVLQSAEYCPRIIRLLCSHIYDATGRSDLGRCRYAAGGFLMGCLFAPAVATPEAFGLVDTVKVDDYVRRHLRIIARVFTHLANGIRTQAPDLFCTKIKPLIEAVLPTYLEFLDALVDLSHSGSHDDLYNETFFPRRQKDDIDVLNRYISKNFNRLRKLLQKRGYKREVLALMSVDSSSSKSSAAADRNALLCFGGVNIQRQMQVAKLVDTPPLQLSHTLGPPPTLHASAVGSGPTLGRFQESGEESGGTASKIRRRARAHPSSNSTSNLDDTNERGEMQPLGREQLMKTVGVGIEIDVDVESRLLCVRTLADGGPAHRCGQIRVGDILLEIDGVPVDALTGDHVNAAKRKLYGPAGSAVKLTLKDTHTRNTNPDAQIKYIKLTRNFVYAPQNSTELSASGHRTQGSSSGRIKVIKGVGQVFGEAPTVRDLGDRAPFLTPTVADDEAIEISPPKSQDFAHFGVGLRIDTREDGLFVVGGIDTGSAAHRSSAFKTGDVITHIGGEQLGVSMPLDIVMVKLSGPLYSDVEITIRRSGEAWSRRVVLQRGPGANGDEERCTEPLPASVRETPVVAHRSQSGRQPSSGVGVKFTTDRDKNFVVKEVKIGGPAAFVGSLLKGDIIESVDGTRVSGLGVRDFSSLVTGPEGSVCSLIVQRNTESKLIEIRRGATASEAPSSRGSSESVYSTDNESATEDAPPPLRSSMSHNKSPAPSQPIISNLQVHANPADASSLRRAPASSMTGPSVPRHNPDEMKSRGKNRGPRSRNIALLADSEDIDDSDFGMTSASDGEGLGTRSDTDDEGDRPADAQAEPAAAKITPSAREDNKRHVRTIAISAQSDSDDESPMDWSCPPSDDGSSVTSRKYQSDDDPKPLLPPNSQGLSEVAGNSVVEIGGVDIEWEMDDDHFYIAAHIPSGDSSEISPGDILRSIAGEGVRTMSRKTLMEKMSGEVGSTVAVCVERSHLVIERILTRISLPSPPLSRRMKSTSSGIGVSLGLSPGGGTFIAAVHSNTPAERCGLSVGDFIVKVGSFLADAATPEQVRAMIGNSRGECLLQTHRPPHPALRSFNIDISSSLCVDDIMPITPPVSARIPLTFTQSTNGIYSVLEYDGGEGREEGERYRLQRGDAIEAVDGTPTRGLHPNQFDDLMRGPFFSTVEFQIARESPQWSGLVFVRRNLIESVDEGGSEGEGEREGGVAGVGMSINPCDGGSVFEIIELADHGAAKACGLIHVGDSLLQVNGIDVYRQGLSLSEVCELIVGPYQSSVSLRLLRESDALPRGYQVLQVELSRGVASSSVPWRIIDDEESEEPHSTAPITNDLSSSPSPSSVSPQHAMTIQSWHLAADRAGAALKLGDVDEAEKQIEFGLALFHNVGGDAFSPPEHVIKESEILRQSCAAVSATLHRNYQRATDDLRALTAALDDADLPAARNLFRSVTDHLAQLPSANTTGHRQFHEILSEFEEIEKVFRGLEEREREQIEEQLQNLSKAAACLPTQEYSNAQHHFDTVSEFIRKFPWTAPSFLGYHDVEGKLLEMNEDRRRKIDDAKINIELQIKRCRHHVAANDLAAAQSSLQIVTELASLVPEKMEDIVEIEIEVCTLERELQRRRSNADETLLRARRAIQSGNFLGARAAVEEGRNKFLSLGPMGEIGEIERVAMKEILDSADSLEIENEKIMHARNSGRDLLDISCVALERKDLNNARINLAEARNVLRAISYVEKEDDDRDLMERLTQLENGIKAAEAEEQELARAWHNAKTDGDKAMSRARDLYASKDFIGAMEVCANAKEIFGRVGMEKQCESVSVMESQIYSACSDFILGTVALAHEAIEKLEISVAKEHMRVASEMVRRGGETTATMRDEIDRAELRIAECESNLAKYKRESEEASGEREGESNGEDRGIGVKLFRAETSGEVSISAIREGGPAHKSRSVFVGDIVVAVDGSDVVGKSLELILSRIVGKDGTVAQLGLLRGPNKDFVTASVPRQSITMVTGGAAAAQNSNPWISDTSKWCPEFEVDQQREQAGADSGDVKTIAARKERGGVGLTFYSDPKGRLVVKRVTEGGPAHSTQQISKGDVLISIDGAPTKNMSQKDLARAVMGDVGSVAALELQRGGVGPTRLVTVIRRQSPSGAATPTKPISVQEEASEVMSGYPSDASQATAASAYSSLSDWSDSGRPTKDPVISSENIAAPAVGPAKTSTKVGLGMTFTASKDGGKFLIKRVTEGGAAFLGGLSPGDRLVTIGGISVDGMTQKELGSAVLGRPGTSVEITVMKHSSSGDESFTVTLLRVASQTPTATQLDTPTPDPSIPVPKSVPEPVAAAETAPPPPAARKTPKAGLGLTFKKDRSGFYIIKRLTDGGPAKHTKAVREGDRLISVGGVEVSELSQQELAKLVLGSEGSSVTIQVQSPEDGPLRSVELVRRSTATGGEGQSETESVGGYSSRGSETSDAESMRLSAAGSESEDDPQSREARGKAGLGITMKIDKQGSYVIKRLTPGGPAERSGRVHAGDVLISIGGMSVRSMSQKEIARAILGPYGSAVEIVIERGAGQTQEIILHRSGGAQ